VISIALSVTFDWTGTRAAKSCSYEFTLAFTLRAQRTIVVSLQWRRGEASQGKTHKAEAGGRREASICCWFGFLTYPMRAPGPPAQPRPVASRIDRRAAAGRAAASGPSGSLGS
jgi:hypothetical protein